MEIGFLSGAQATDRLRQQSFVDAWERLRAACPWATGYQSAAFVLAWYESYADTMEPLLVTAQGAASGEFDGLLALAREKETGALVNAGGHQAEYDCWIARDAASDSFISAALTRLRERHPGASLRFRYLPPGCPLGWIDGDRALGRLAERRDIPRPLLALESEQAFADKLRKKGNKSRLNRLRDAGGGELSCSTITDEAELAVLIDEIARNYDSRQEAMNDVRPFGDDERKKDFHLRLLRAGVLHAFVLRAGSSMVSAILSVKSGDTLSVGVLSHSVELAEHSPGKFGMLFLAREAASQGYRTIDLTPGGAWKDRFASTHDSVTELTIRFSAMQARVVALREQALASTKQLLAVAGVTPQDIRRLGNRLKAGSEDKRKAS